MTFEQSLSSQFEGASFDGVICIGGEDWWYHNRGHFDFQVMRRLARVMPVLFVNSIGVRMPSVSSGSVFAKRIGRKLKSLGRGVQNVENRFWVFSPFSIPGKTAAAFSSRTLAPQISLAAARAGIRKPLLWVHCPPGAELVDRIAHEVLVFQRTDRFEAFPEGDRAVLTEQVSRMKARADLVVYAARHLMDEERGEVKDATLVTHGVDLERFVMAGDQPGIGPRDIAFVKRPRVGFIGGIDEHTFDPDLFVQVAGQMPDHQFILVGGCSLPADWCELENVRQVGRKSYDVIASYMAAMDCLIMPWNRSDWIKACNPIKLKEYLAVGRPLVSTDFAALDPFRSIVRVAQDADGFAEAIRQACAEPFDPLPGRQRLSGESWDDKTLQLAEALRVADRRRRGQEKACSGAEAVREVA